MASTRTTGAISGADRETLIALSLAWYGENTTIQLNYEHRDFISPFDRGTALDSRTNKPLAIPATRRLDESTTMCADLRPDAGLGRSPAQRWTGSCMRATATTPKASAPTSCASPRSTPSPASCPPLRGLARAGRGGIVRLVQERRHLAIVAPLGRRSADAAEDATEIATGHCTGATEADRLRSTASGRHSCTNRAAVSQRRTTLPAGAGTVVRIRSWARDASHDGARDEFRIDAVTGRLVSSEIYADKPIGERILASVLDIHRGSIFGWPGQLLFMVAAA